MSDPAQIAKWLTEGHHYTSDEGARILARDWLLKEQEVATLQSRLAQAEAQNRELRALCGKAKRLCQQTAILVVALRNEEPKVCAMLKAERDELLAEFEAASLNEAKRAVEQHYGVIEVEGKE